MSNQPYFNQFSWRNKEAISYWWYKIFADETNLKQITNSWSPLKPKTGYGLIYYYLINGQIKYIGKTTSSLSQRMTTYAYRYDIRIKMLNAFKDNHLSITTREIRKIDLDIVEQNEIKLHSQTNQLWNIAYNSRNNFNKVKHTKLKLNSKPKESDSSSHKSRHRLNQRTPLVIITCIILLVMIFTLIFSLSTNSSLTTNKVIILSNSRQSDMQKIASTLIQYRQQYGALPSHKTITVTWRDRHIFLYNKESLSLYKTANIKNTLNNGKLESGQSYYNSAPSVNFDQFQPLPNISNFHILVGYKCPSSNIEIYNLIPASEISFAIVYYDNNLYKCLHG